MARKENTKQAGVSDDALTTDVGSGSKLPVHGVVIDSIGHATATHLLPRHTRNVLWRVLDSTQNPRFPLYSDENYWDPATKSWNYTNSAASALLVTTQDAEDWKSGDSSRMARSRFALYADRPLNTVATDRANFWALHPNAAELDAAMLLEPQVLLFDALSQYFMESASFHFGYLADIDAEYHRMRDVGPLGRFNDASNQPAWHNLYHYWRDVLQRDYLEPGHVTLPVGLQQGNWTISDVLGELYRMASPDGQNLHTDMVLTVQGAMRGVTGATLGLVSGEEYLDTDGNSRFYHPFMRISRNDASGLTLDFPEMSMVTSYGDGAFEQVSHTDIPTVSGLQPLLLGTTTPTTEGTIRTDRPFLFASHAGIPTWPSMKSLGDADAKPHDDLFPQDVVATTLTADQTVGLTNVDNIGYISEEFTAFTALPVSGTVGAARGYTVRFDLLVEAMKSLGRMGEPEVVENLLPQFGVITSADVLGTRSTGLTVKRYTDLYNLYEARFAFNENPSRKYTGAHVGPSSLVLPSSGDNVVTIGDVPITTRKTLANGQSVDVSVRERYWTPPVLDAEDVNTVITSFFPGVRVKDTSMGSINFTGADGITSFPQLNREFISRTLGGVPSMYTKVEKPVFMPAGKATPDSVYASGVGIGAVQLLDEMMRAALAAPTRFSNGYGGFTDFSATYDAGEVLGSRYRFSLVKEAARPTNPLTATSGGFGAEYSYFEVGEKLAAVRGASDLEDIFGWYTSLIANSPIADPFSATGKAWASPVVTNSMSLSKSSTSYDGNAHVYGAYNGASLCSTSEEVSPLTLAQQWGYLDMDEAHLASLVNSQGHPADYQLAILPLTVSCGTETMEFDTGMSGIIGGAYNTGEVATKAYEAQYTDYGMEAIPVVVNGEVKVGSVGSLLYAMTSPASTMNWLVPQVSPADVCKTLIYEGHAAALARNADGDYESDPFQFPENGALAFTMGMGLYLCQNNVVRAQLATYETMYSLEQVDRPSIRTPGNTDPHDSLVNTSVTATFSPIGGQPIDVSLQRETLSYSEFKWTESTVVTPDLGLGVGGADFMDEVLGPTHGLYDGNVPEEKLGWLSAGFFDNLIVRPPVNPGSVLNYTRTSLWTDARALHTLGGSFSVPQVTSNVQTDGPWEDLAINALPIWGPIHRNTYGDNASLAATQFTHSKKLRCMADFENNLAADPRWDVGGVLLKETFGVTFDGLASGCTANSFAPGGNVRALGNSANRNIPQVIMPDEPEHKMLHRPWRSIVDAAVHKEQRLTFLNTKEEPHFTGGRLAISTIGAAKSFRLEDLINAGEENQYLLEVASSRTRMTDPSYRSIMTFGRIMLTDPATSRHILPDVANVRNQGSFQGAQRYASQAAGGKLVYDRAFLRDLQSGRQAQRNSR